MRVAGCIRSPARRPRTLSTQAEVDAYAQVGLFGEGETPNAGDFIGDMAAGVYDGAVLIWPG